MPPHAGMDAYSIMGIKILKYKRFQKLLAISVDFEVSYVGHTQT